MKQDLAKFDVLIRPEERMRIITCDETYSAPILAIFNDAIANSTALYEYKPRTMETMKTWFATKRS